MQASAERNPSECGLDPTLTGRPIQLYAEGTPDIEPAGSLTAHNNTVLEVQKTDGTGSEGSNPTSAPDDDRAVLDANEGETENSGKVFKCPYLFHGQKPCPTNHRFIRDVIRHLKSHGRFFCSNCSNFGDASQKKQHICGKMACIDLHCPNRQSGVQAHERKSGCSVIFNSLGNRRKWNALFALEFPNYPLPPWVRVCVMEKETVPSISIDTIMERPRAAILPPLSEVPHGLGPTAARILVLPIVLTSGQHSECSSLALSPDELDALNNTVFQQLVNQALIRGSIRQTAIIMEHSEEHRRQRVLNERQDQAFQDLRNEVAALRGTMALQLNSSVQQIDGTCTNGMASIDDESD